MTIPQYEYKIHGSLLPQPSLQNIGPDSAIPTWTPSRGGIGSCGSHGPWPHKSHHFIWLVVQ